MDFERRGAFRAWPFLSKEEKEDLRCLSILVGDPIKDRDLSEVLSEWEETQQDYDDLWWHRKSVMSLMDGNHCPCCIRYSSKGASLVKAKNMSFRSNWGDNNAKRKTIRTHRDGSRRDYRLRSQKGA